MLGTLLDAAEKFEAGLPVEDSHLRRLLAGGTTAGRTRSKATVCDEMGEGLDRKFPSEVIDGCHLKHKIFDDRVKEHPEPERHCRAIRGGSRAS